MRLRSPFAFFLFCMVLLCWVACEKEAGRAAPALNVVPEGFPEMPEPADNAFSVDRWELGKKLFFDPILSIDSSKSCGSCHQPSLAFADIRQFSPGAMNRPGVRNSPSLANVGYQPYLLREGSVPTLEMQVAVPIQESNEFAHNIVLIAETLQLDPSYVAMSKAAYDRAPDPFVITRAIAVFQRTLISGNSAYDKDQQGKTGQLSHSQERGKALFFSEKAACSNCHGGFNFTNYQFENNGLYLSYEDEGRQRFTGKAADEARFKVPSLRNVAVTPPYMHDGSFTSLSEVINHYNEGGKGHINQSTLVQPLGLTAQDKADLEAFLEALTDYDFLSNSNFSP